MKKWKPEKKETEFKARKLYECGHVDKRDWTKCGILTSKLVTLSDGRKIHLCATHAKQHEPKG